MTRLGMDTVAVRELAMQLEVTAGQLESVAAAANSIVGSFAHHWTGGDAESLARAWQYQHRAAVFALSGHIRSMASTARQEADQQDHASSAASLDGGGSAGGSGTPGRQPFDFDRVNSAIGRVGQVLGIPDDARNLARAWDEAPDFQRWLKHAPQLERALQRTGDAASDAMSTARHFGSEAASHLHISEEAQHLGGKVIGGVGIAAGLYSVGVDGWKAGGDVAAHHYWSAFNDTSDAVSSGLKSTKSPALYLGGVVVSEYTDIANQVHSIDWSQGVPIPTPSNLYHIYGPALADSVASLPSHVFKWFT